MSYYNYIQGIYIKGGKTKQGVLNAPKQKTTYIYIQSSLDIPGFSGETKNARYIEGHGISRDPFSGAKFQSKSLNFYILMPTVNRVVLGLCKRYVCNLINFPIPCLNLSGIIRLLTFSVLLRSTICLLPGPLQQAGGLGLLCTLVSVSSRHYSHILN